jgi:hypothetical protein
MKRIKKGPVWGVAIILSAVFLLGISCKGPEGPQGPPGTELCSTCHSDNTEILAREIQYQNSTHYLGGNYERDYFPCAGCHTHEGFIVLVEGGDTTQSIVNPTPPNCRTCHNIHETYTWEDFQLKTTATVNLREGGTFDMGAGNLCANCHQSRASDVIPSGQDTVYIWGPYWGPHHSPVANLISGQGGFEEFSGNYPSTPHYSAITGGCPECHMAEPYGSQAGGHTMNMFYEYHGQTELLTAGCEECHSDPVSEFETADSILEANLDSLRTILINAGIMDSTDHAVAGNWPRNLAGGLWNYLFVKEGHGVHNFDYANSLLENTIQALSGGN